MSMAKKSAKTSTAKKSAQASQGPAAGNSGPIARRSLNPLPENEVGGRLLVRLQAEKIMKKLHLKERWEHPDGWDFNDLCAVVAHAMGEEYTQPGEDLVVDRVITSRSEKLIEKIRVRATPKLIDTAGGSETLMPEVYEGLLILGLGTKEIPINLSSNAIGTTKLAEDLAKLMEVKKSRVNARVFERAKRNVKTRYEDHMHRQAARELLRVAISIQKRKPKVKTPGRSQRSLLQEAIGKLTLEGSLLAPDNKRLVQGFLASIGINPPAS